MSRTLGVLGLFFAPWLLALLPAPTHAHGLPQSHTASDRQRSDVEEALERLPTDPSAIVLIEKALADPDPAVRLQAVSTIATRVNVGSLSVGPEDCMAGDYRWEHAPFARVADAASSKLDDADPKVRAAVVALLEGRELMAEHLRAACVGGARRAMTVEGGQRGYLSDGTSERLHALRSDPDLEVRRAVRQALLGGATIDDRYVDLLLDAASDPDVESRWAATRGMQRIEADLARAVAVTERLATAPVAVRREGCNAVALWEADAQLLERVQAWDVMESDPATRACLGEIVARQKARLVYLNANAGALARARALESLVEDVSDVAEAVPAVRAALRDPEALVRVAALQLVVEWTVGRLEFVVETPASFGGDGPPGMRTVTLEDFATEIAALVDDPEPGVQGVALELFSKADLLRQFDARLELAPGPGPEFPTLSPSVAARLSRVPATADPFVRRVAARTLLRYAAVDAAHVDRVIEGLTSTDNEIAEDAARSIGRIGADRALLTTLIGRVRELPAEARRQGVHGVASLMISDGGSARAEAWATAEGGSAVGRDLRAFLNGLERER